MTDTDVLEEAVMYQAKVLATAQEELDTEYLRLVALGENPFVANRKADYELGRYVTLAKAAYEVALARLRR